MVALSGASHIGSALSAIDILSVLYIEKIMSGNGSRDDCFVMSKGHAAAGLYSVLANIGFFPKTWLESYSQDGSSLMGHVTTHGVPGVELSTGSLGHGLPYSVGVALAMRRMGDNDSRVYVLTSDGEWNEGSNWEAALQAAHFKLANLTVLVDRNRLQSLKDTEETIGLEPFRAKFEAFGWYVNTSDGHDHLSISRAIDDAAETGRLTGQPQIIVCNTTKGKGVSFMENSVAWHYKSPNQTELRLALDELEAFDA
jgi:transketolase